MKLNRVDHVDLLVSDIKRSVEFYKKFGFVVQGTLDKGKSVFLWNGDEQSSLVIELHQIESGQQPGLGHLALYVDDVDASYKELSKAGLSFHIKPQTGTQSGRTIANTKDPDGIEIQLAKKVMRGEYEDFK